MKVLYNFKAIHKNKIVLDSISIQLEREERGKKGGRWVGIKINISLFLFYFLLLFNIDTLPKKYDAVYEKESEIFYGPIEILRE